MRHEDVQRRLEEAGYSPLYQYRFHPDRDWRFAFAFPEEKIGIDVLERGHRIVPDRMVEAQLEGWIVLTMSYQMLSGPRLAFYLERAFSRRALEAGQG